MDQEDYDPNDPERHLKRIDRVFGVSSRIQNLVLRRKKLPPVITSEEKLAEKLKNVKEQRTQRMGRIGFKQNYLLEMISLHLNVDLDTLIDCAADSEEHIRAIEQIFEANGTYSLLVQYQETLAPGIESGRFNPKLRHEKTFQALFSSGIGKKISGKSVFVYRLSNVNDVDVKNLGEDLFFSSIPDEEYVISSILNNVVASLRPALETSKEYGNCSDGQKFNFIHGVDLFLKFLKTTQSDIINCMINFEVSHDLYKGHLLVPHQVEGTAKKPDKVAEVERAFAIWMKKIENAMVMGHQIRQNTEEVGPADELDHWRSMLTKYNNIIEFTNSKPFLNYLSCLKLSRSKLVKKWHDIDNDVVAILNEARDNVKYMTSIEQFWDPLYRCDPPEIIDSLPSLLQAIVTVFRSSKFYTSSERVTGFLSKVTNQIIIACQNFLTNREKDSIWTQNQREIVKKIDLCKNLLSAYKERYYKITKEMNENPDDTPWECSEVALFGRLETFNIRLNKIKEILEIILRYKILDYYKISGMEVFSESIKKSFQIISEKDYDPLAHRHFEFDKDFNTFQMEIDNVELEMQKFVKDTLGPMCTTDQRLLTLKRFERLKLDCLCLDRRYLDAAELLEKEIADIKDYYNEDRANPPLEWNTPTAVGRIMWIRNLFRKIDEPMKVFRSKGCVIEHKRAQLCVKYYNYLSGVFLHYEMLYHKAWYEHVEQVRTKLETPIIRKNLETKMLEVNLDRYVIQVIRETETMCKLGLEVPMTPHLLIHCKEKVLDAYDIIVSLIDRNNKLRKSIQPMFLPLMRTQLIELERIFAQGLTQLTWVSLKLTEYFEEIDTTLTRIERFVKDVVDINDARIEVCFDEIEMINLIDLPEDAVSPEEFLEMNQEHRRKVEKKLAWKAKTAEIATIELITRFIDAIDVEENDEIGRRKFQLPPNLITEDNWRVEEKKPIDKYDWIHFGKIFKAVMYPLPDVNLELCFKEYDGLKYDVTLLHIDCTELFAYYNQRLVSALVKCTKSAMEKLKLRTNLIVDQLSEPESNEPPILTTWMELKIPDFMVTPSIPQIQEKYEAVISNIIEANHAVATWGKLAKTLERNKRKPLIDEIRYDKNFHQIIENHKEVFRFRLGFDKGLMQKQTDVNNFSKELFEKYKFLWDEDREDQIEKFVEKNPLTVDIRDRLLLYDKITEDVLNMEKIIVFGPIKIFMDRVIPPLTEESKSWKIILGRKLSAFYKTILDEMVQFISAQLKVLNRDLNDLEDCRIAMLCLGVIRDNFIRIDQTLDLIEATYSMFHSFNISISSEDNERVESLRYMFTNMQHLSEKVAVGVVQMQPPLMQELEEGLISFKTDLEQFEYDFEHNGPMVEGIPAKEASDRVLWFQSRYEELWRRFERYTTAEELFGMPKSDYPVLHKRKKDFNLLNKLYSLYLQVMKTIDEYCETPWSQVDMEKINADIQEFHSRCKKLPRAMKDWPAFIDLKKKIDDFYESCPLIELMADKSMKDRHWEKIEAAMEIKYPVDSPTFTLGDVLETPILQFKDEIEDVCVGAVKEKDIESKLKQVVAEWSQVSLTFAPFKTRGELLIKSADVVEIVANLEDSLMVVSSLASNRFNAPFKKDILLWQQKLSNTNEILERWMQVQNLWVYLEAVFVGGDIAKQLPAESKRFTNIDRSWVRIMYKARDNPIVVDCCTSDDIIANTLNFLLQQLEACQKSLTGYLESKRLIFPRFFFISDPVLLEILGQASDPKSIQPHLESIFGGVSRVAFEGDKSDEICSMLSENGEEVLLNYSVKCIGHVELWLGKLLSTVQETIKTVLSKMTESLRQHDFSFIAEIPNYCAQAGLMGLQLLWTADAEFALNKARKFRKIMQTTNKKFLDLLNSLVDLTTKDLTKLERISIETMITIHVHQRDIFDDLVNLKIMNANNFEWQKQSRFYYEDETEEVFVKITDITFAYQNEYLGVKERLAITPLTDRCYITLAQAIGMCMGGAPAGPAGTGKTETVKDMAGALGKYVIVFNCSDQMDFRGLGRIFKGLAQSGSWGCFDEFNRIDLPVLSVAAQQIHIVLSARKAKVESFIFSDGDKVTLNAEFGIFITMNPGYAGRQELPENLKIQFRSVAMMVPDRQIIMRVKLASCGFRDNIVLARKFFTLYKLCEEQLSKQIHYDFGLRNILSCLRTLGAQKRAAPPKTKEDVILMRVLKDMNLSKLVDEDEPLFKSLISDLFPGIEPPSSSYKELQQAIQTATEEFGLINEPSWNLKVIQLYETSLVRHGLMVLGPTGAGKTKCMNTLLRAFTIRGDTHKEFRMNPKAITAPQMFGRLDPTTNDWTDGIFSVLWRRTLKFKKEYVWLVIDGPVDAVYIENLNSVLDDNKTLTLANGDRIVMSPNCKLVFEPDNVDNASPATISRMGMVFMSSSVLQWNTFVEAWYKTLPAYQIRSLRRSFDKIYADLLLFVETKLEAKMNVLEANYIRQTCDLLTGLLTSPHEAQTKFSDSHIERLFLFSLMWSLGSVIELEDRIKMEEFVLQHPSKMRWPKLEGDESIFEFLVSSKGQWEHWNTQITEYIYPSDKVPEYSEILVPNVDNVRTAFLIDLIANQKKSVLLIGEQGTAKTVMIKGYMSQYDPEEHMSKSLSFSSATSPNMFQRIIESYMEKRVGTTYGPPQMRKMSIFIDDINMPMLNEWGDQITNEIVRQLMEAGGFYSLDRPGDFSTIMDIQILSAMIHPGGGRNDIPARLKRQFNIFNCTLPTITSMDKIFGIIGKGYFCSARFKPEVVNFVSNLIPLTRILWQFTKQKMLPTPAKFHYIFNLRDLSRIWGGMLKIQSAQCQNINTLLKLWRHECIRVFSDRFTTFEDKDWFTKKMNEIAQQELGNDYEYFPQEDSYFVDFLQDSPDVLPEDDEEISDDFFVYEEIPSFDVVKTRIEFFMAQYNKEVRGAKLDLVLFQDALIHLMIISRILRTSRGNALLVGVGGSGKQSLTKLASFIAGYKNHQITLTRAYNITNLADDFKYLYKVAGFDGDGITFIFTDNDIKDEAFLEYLNNVLNSGEIANLFTKEEIDEITSELVPIMKKADPRRIPSNDNLYDFFISRARKNLHVVLCFSPVGEKFRSRALKFPGLISGCVVDWFQKWPMDALVEVSKHFLTNYSVQCTNNVKEQLIQMMAYVQDYISGICIEYFERFRRQTHVTPKSFLTFLEGYKVIYTERKENISMLADRMVTGLVKLDEAAEQVSTLKVEIEKKKEEIVLKEAEVQIVLDSVQDATEKANIAKGEVDISIEKQDVLVREIDAEAKITEEKLLLAQPALEEAENALKTIKNTDIATVRKLANPPHLITVIMDVVCIMFRRRVESVKIDLAKKFLVTSWNESLKVMADTRFLIKIVNYNRDLINAEMIDLMIPYFKYPQYTFEAAKTACGNVAGLLQWTKAMAKFFDVNKDILPLKANLKIQRLRHAKANEALQELEDTLITKLEEVRKLEMMCEQANADLQVVKEEAQLYQDKLNAATEMIEGLSEEKINWTLQTKIFEDETIRLVGDSVILIGFLSYTGPFNQEYRALVQKHWYDELIRRRIPVSGSIDLIDTLTDPATVGEWKLQGLPNDELSIQNAIIVTQATRYPLLIDPQSQGKSWIKNREKAYGLVVTSLNHRYFRNHFEDAVSYGTPLLIEDVGEELDPCMDNVLERNYIKMGTSWKVKVGDKEIDTNEEFRLYITTKLSNPVYTPEVAARTSIIDFAVTMRGLEDQLLGRVILSERKEMEAERVNLISDVTSMKRLKKDLEADLLKKLSTASGSLLDDLSVMEVLNSNKEKSIEIRDKMETTEVTVANINTAREEFRPIATRGSILYFLIVSMSQVNNMYQTSLVQFLERFDFSLERADKSPITYKRIRLIIEYLTYDIFKYKSRGLYETHKFLFVLLMTLNIDLEREKITFEEFQTFIKGGAALDINSCPVKPCKWITDMTWLNLVSLSSLRQFNTILEHIGRNEKMWRVWFEKNAPEEEPMPDTYKEMDEFRKLLLIRSWCADRTLLQSRKYISSSLGERFASPFVLDYDELFEESRALSPIICLLSMGSDPTPSIEQLAKKNEIRLNSISMGQGQEVHARKLILKSLEKGRWVLLQNCHLSLEYMSEIMDQLTDLQVKGPEAYHENFRLWITTECHKDFPITLLQISVKFTNEPPSGVKAGLMKTYRSMSSDIMEYSINKYYIGIIYTISFLHTIVQERRKFGPLGWNVPYEFNLSDWIASCYFTQNHLDEVDPKKPEDINWNTVRYMIGEVQYGGRVTDDYDKRFLICLTNAWFFDNMFEPEFEFYKGYKIISKKTTEDYLEEIDKLPSIDSPEVCKLHPNADITFQTNKAKEILDTIISIQPKESAGTGGETRESVVSRVVTEMLEKVPEPYLEYEVKERLTKTISSMNIFLRQEIDRIQKVIHLVRNTLTDLLLAIEGTIIMNEDLRDAFDNIYDARVPKIWIRYSWISSTLGFWFTELIERNNQFYSWCFKARPPMFWMSGFFNPQGFLTAMKQEVARANNGWALDKVALHNEVTKISAEDCKDPPKSGVYVYGLFLDGAGWQRKTCSLIESTNKVLYTVMPIIHIDAINSTAPKHPSLYECPVYKKPSRTGLNFITPLWLQSQKPPDHWVLRGVALLCDIK